MSQAKNREKSIARAGFVGIIANLALVAMKLVIGIISFSLSIILDAVNNAGDALSSIITIFGVKIASKPADKGHPLGHGRAEYMSAIIIAGLILAAAFYSLFEAINRAINPSPVSYTEITIVMISIGILVKILLGAYTLYVSKKTDSPSLKASSFDAFFDAAISLTTLIGVIVFMASGVNIDAYLSMAISIVILKEGIDLLMESMNKVLGQRSDPSISKSIREAIMEEGSIEGVYDMFLDNYGPNRLVGFAHIEVDESLSAKEIDELCRSTTTRIYQRFGAYVSLSIYAVPSPDSPYRGMYLSLKEKILSLDGVLQVHGFHVNEEEKIIYFDVVRDFKINDEKAWVENIKKEASSLYPDYSYIIEADLDYSD